MLLIPCSRCVHWRRVSSVTSEVSGQVDHVGNDTVLPGHGCCANSRVALVVTSQVSPIATAPNMTSRHPTGSREV
jgi:hypothetical protein